MRAVRVRSAGTGGTATSRRRGIVPARLAVVLLVAVVVAGACGKGGSSGGGKDVTVLTSPRLKRTVDRLAKQYKAKEKGNVKVVVDKSKGLAEKAAKGDADVYVDRAGAVSAAAKKRKAQKDAKGIGSDRMQLVVAKGNPKQLKGLEVFAQPGIKTVLCQDDKPCGRVAQQQLQKAKVTAAPGQKVGSAKEVLDAVSSGAADVGLLLRSDVHGAKVEGVDLPADVAVGVAYKVLVLKSSGGGKDFLKFVESDPGKFVLATAGIKP